MVREDGGRRRDVQRRVPGEVEADTKRLGSGRRRLGTVLCLEVHGLDPLDPRQCRERVDDGSVGRPVGGELERPFAFEAADQRSRRVEREQTTVIHDRDPVGEERRLVHVVRREDERDLRVAQLA